MSICWYCYWGWPKPIAEIYRRHIAEAGESAMHFGPAHIVWEDENFGRGNVQWCIDHFDEHRGDHGEKELAAVMASLKDLLALGDDILEAAPKDYDGQHPEMFPPTMETEKCP